MKKKYKVRNFYEFISIPCEDDKKAVFLEYGNLNEMKPFEKMLTWEEIQHANIMSDVFKSGRLEFLEADQEELYEELEINADNVLTAQEVFDTVQNPTKEKLEKVVEVTSLNTIDLFRGLAISMRNLGNEDVSNRVLAVLNKRRDEIYKDPTKPSTITIKKTRAEERIEEIEEKRKDEISVAVEDATKALKAKIKKLENALAKSDVSETEDKPKRGRPSTKKTEEATE